MSKPAPTRFIDKHEARHMPFFQRLQERLRLGLGATLLLAVLMAQPAAAQEHEVIGTVMSQQDEEDMLPGVNVTVKGTTTGTTTGPDGTYSLTAPSATDTLVFSFVGYETQEEPISGRSTIDVELTRSVVEGEEVVVVGYGEQERSSVTGSVSEIDGEAITSVSVPNASDLLAGTVSGVMTKQTSGVPGGNHRSLSVRGFGSPLVLVDGMEMALDAIDQEDIESISVLKDASAAIYGSRAGNGVILVQTKQGEMGEPSITLSSDFSAQTPTYWPEHVTAAQYAEMRREGQLYMGVEPSFTEEDVENYQNGVEGYESYNWYDATFRDYAPMQDHNLSVTGGSEAVRYFLSGGFKDQVGAFESGDLSFRQFNGRANVEATISENLTASTNFSVRREIRNRPGQTIRQAFVDMNRVQPFYPPTFPDTSLATFAGFGGSNPIASSQREQSGFVENRFSFLDGNAALDYEIPGVQGLTAGTELGYRFNWRFIKSLDRLYNLYEYDEGADTYTQVGGGGGDQIQESNRQFWELRPVVSLNYDRTFGDHEIQGLALTEWIVSKVEYWGASRQGMVTDQLPYLFAGTLNDVQNSGSASESGRMSYVGRINYGYKDPYQLEATLRADATHKFPEDSRWGLFPSVSAAWLPSEESFMDDVDALNQLKLRASYSQSGDDNVGAFQHLTGYNLRSVIGIIGNEPQRLLQEGGLPNPSITWREMTVYNAGIDATFWDGLLSTTLDVFYRRTDNIFGQPLESYPSSYGANLPQLNINATDDRGFELTVGHENNVTDKFRYSVSGNVGISREKYVDWSEPEYDTEDGRRVRQNEGNWVNRRVGYVSQGLFESQEEIDNWDLDQDGDGNSTLRPGDIKYEDLNGDGELTWRDQREIGYGSFPDMSYGLTLNASYGNVSARALFQGASMFTMNFSDIARMPFFNESTPFQYQYEHRWVPDDPEGDNPQNVNPDAVIPYIDGTGGGWTANNTRYSDFWLRDGTYLRLKNLNVTYAMPESIIQPLGLQNLSLSVSGSNLLTWDNLGIFSGSFDPESPSTQNARQYPPVSTYTFSVNVSI